MRHDPLVLLALAVAACEGQPFGVAPAGSTVGQATLVATGPLPFAASRATAVAGDVTCPVEGVPTAVRYVAVIASEDPEACARLQRGEARAYGRSIVLGVLQPAGGDVAPGTYAIAPAAAGAANALAAIQQLDAVCSASILRASSGSLILTATAEGQLRGSVQASLPGGELSGTFDAEVCAGVAPADVCAGAIGSTAPACTP